LVSRTTTSFGLGLTTFWNLKRIFVVVVVVYMIYMLWYLRSIPQWFLTRCAFQRHYMKFSKSDIGNNGFLVLFFGMIFMAFQK
jgi:hypothetical protein